MHLWKTKVMFNNHATPADIVVDGTTIERVKSYVYLGRTITQDSDFLPEIKRRIALEWAAFAKVNNIMRSRNANMKVNGKSSTNISYL